MSTDIVKLRSKSHTQTHTHSFSSLLTHVERRHASLWCRRIHGGHAGGHEVCDLLQSQQARGCLALLQLILDHCFQLIAECLPVINADRNTKNQKIIRAKKEKHLKTEWLKNKAEWGTNRQKTQKKDWQVYYWKFNTLTPCLNTLFATLLKILTWCSS